MFALPLLFCSGQTVTARADVVAGVQECGSCHVKELLCDPIHWLGGDRNDHALPPGQARLSTHQDPVVLKGATQRRGL